MNRLQVTFLVFTLFITTSFLFQNCGKMEAATQSSNERSNDGGDNDDDNGDTQCTAKPINQLENRWLPGAASLDNEVSLNDQGEFEETIEWSIGSENVVLHYETNKYPEAAMKCKSTIVTIRKADDSIDVELKVDADHCRGTKILTSTRPNPQSKSEVEQLTEIISESLEYKSEKKPDEYNNNTSGCNFPRLSMNNKSNRNGESSPDFDIYYTPPECVPSSGTEDKDKVFISNTDSIDRIEEFFKEQIDSVCQSQN